MVSQKREFVKARVHCTVTPREALRMLRELQGFTQADLADATGISQSSLSAFERGARQLRRESAVILANALCVHPAILLFPDFDMRKWKSRIEPSKKMSMKEARTMSAAWHARLSGGSFRDSAVVVQEIRK